MGGKKAARRQENLYLFDFDKTPRAFHNSKAHPVGFRAAAQLRCLALSHLSIRRKCHESAMSIVMTLS